MRNYNKIVVCLALCVAAASFGNSAARAAQWSQVNRIATISYAPDSWVIGNALPSWHDLIEGPPTGVICSGSGCHTYRWGKLYGPQFDYCAWINDDAKSAYGGTVSNPCPWPGQQIDTPFFFRTFTDGFHNSTPSDGGSFCDATNCSYFYAYNNSQSGGSCQHYYAYANVEPWRVPATPGDAFDAVGGHGTTTFPVRWRYISKDGYWTLVNDPSPIANEPNWYFVDSYCITYYSNVAYTPGSAVASGVRSAQSEQHMTSAQVFQWIRAQRATHLQSQPPFRIIHGLKP